MVNRQVIIPKAWRSELGVAALFGFTLPLSVYLSNELPRSIIHGEMIPLSEGSVMLSLPLFWLIPAFFLGLGLYRIYNVRYVVDGLGIESREGILSFHQRIERIRYEDVRNIETRQTLLQRFLDVGKVEIGTAALGSTEMVLDGVAAPHEIREMIQLERERRQKERKNLTREGMAHAG